MSEFGIVTKNTYIKNTKSWSFFFMVVSPLIMIGVIAAITYFFGDIANETKGGTLPIVNADAQTEQFLASQPNPTPFDLTYDLSKEEAQQQLLDEDISGYLLLDTQQTPVKATYYQGEEGSFTAVAKIQPLISLLGTYETAKTAQELHLTADQLQRLQQSQVTVDTVTIDKDPAGHVSESGDGGLASDIRFGIGSFVSVVLFMFVVYYSMLIMQEIASEKGSRIMEIILSSMSATTHFFGKLAGVFLMILTHIAIYIVVFGGAWMFFRSDLAPVKIPPEVTTFLQETNIVQDNLDLIIWGIIYGLLGIVLYSVLAAFLGSLVSRTEDVQKAASPMTLLLLLGFYIGIFGQQVVDSPFYIISSHIPFFSSSIMPLRVAKHLVSPVELGISVVVYLLVILAILWLSITLYHSSVLAYSDAGVWSVFKKAVGSWRSEHRKSVSE